MNILKIIKMMMFLIIEKMKKEINLIKHNINEKVKEVDKDNGIIDEEKLERERLKVDEYELNPEKMKTYDKEVLRHDKKIKGRNVFYFKI